MEIKVTLKDGEKSASFKFAGEPLDIIESGWTRLAKLWEVHPDDDEDDCG